MSIVLSIATSVTMVIVIAVYLYRLVTGKTVINSSTWLITFILMICNSINYFEIVEGSIRDAVFTWVMTVGIGAIFVYATFKGHFERPDRFDGACMGFTGLAVAVWILSGNPVLGTLLFQAAFIVSFIPTLKGLYRRTLVDHPLPWLLAVCAYALQIATLLADPAGSEWKEFIFPVVNGIFGNGSVMLLAWWRLRVV